MMPLSCLTRSHDALNNAHGDRQLSGSSPIAMTQMEPAFMDVDLDVPALRIWRLEVKDPSLP